MRVQHPEKRQHSIEPRDENGAVEPILTDERGIAEVSSAIGESLIEQGWKKLAGEGKSKDEPEAVAPAVEVPEDVVADDETKEK